jgi:hypothetical protein
MAEPCRRGRRRRQEAARGGTCFTGGRFGTKALAVLSRSFVELEYLPKEPDMKTLCTEEILP